LPIRLETAKSRQELLVEGQQARESCILLSGFLCRSKLAKSGERQILSFHTPGEMPDLQSLYLQKMDHTLFALTDCRVGFIAHEHLHRLIATSPTVMAALWRETLLDAVIFREWILNLGRRSAQARLAHLICELYCRLKMVALTEGGELDMPITQTIIADAVGLSSVHVNRVFQDFRQRRLIETDGTLIRILNWQALATEGEFDPTYLTLS
jgi:CRP-like cAMP-binding protein